MGFGWFVALFRITRTRKIWIKRTRKSKGKETISGKAFVVDGDDIRVKNIKIRLYGIDAPEHDQRAKENGRWFNQGAWAKSGLIEVVGGKQVTVEVQGQDRHNRTLGVVFCEGKDICEYMVRHGLAIAAYSVRYKDQEQHARQNRLGLWGTQISYHPRYWRRGEKKYLN